MLSLSASAAAAARLSMSASPSITTTTSSSSPPSYRHEDAAVVIELGARCLRAGFAGDALPLCTRRVAPADAARTGDYRSYMPGRRPRETESGQPFANWCAPHELWRADTRALDLRLFEDRLDRALRAIYNAHLLTNASDGAATTAFGGISAGGSSGSGGATSSMSSVLGAPRRLVLVLPPLLPHPLLAAVLAVVLGRWKHHAVTLLPGPAMAAVAAGLRTALVVDVGWEEAVVSAIYEYRE
ncbi:hypothetical protein KEM52_004660, partial [Ascosphaera acerosa]